MKKRISLLLSIIMLICAASSAYAYPTQGVTTEVTPPAGREYFPTSVEELPVSEALPDLFTFMNPELGTDGRVTTAEEWQARREELKDIIQYYYLGYKQPTAAENVRVTGYMKFKAGFWWFGIPDEIYPADEPFYGDSELSGAMSIAVTNPDTGVTAEIRATGIYIPQYTDAETLEAGQTHIEGPYPVIIGIGSSISANQRNEVLKRGYAIVNLDTASVYTDTTWSPDSDNEAYRSGAYTTLYPYDGTVYEYSSGALMGWAWGVSRIIDAIENGAYDGLLDATRTVVTGNSRNGKAALIAAAFDERISIAAPCDPGQTGTAAYRYTNQAQLFNYRTPTGMNRIYARNEKPNNVLDNSEAHWVNTKAEDFRYDTDRLPFDAHSVEALIAPRPLLVFTGEEYDWLGSPSTVLTVTAAQEVYEFLGAGDNIGVRVHDGMHALQNRDVAYLLAIMEREFRRGGEGDLIVEDVWPELDPPTNGAGTYAGISDFTVSPYAVDSSYIPWSRPGKDVLWLEDELITAGMARTLTIHTTAPSVEITLPDGSILTFDAADGVAQAALTAEQAQQGRYTVTSKGGQDSKTVHFQAMSFADALRQGITINNTNGSEHPIYGFTSKMGKDVAMYADGVKLETSEDESTKDGWVMPYGVKVETSIESYDVLTLKHLTLAALPGYTFEVSFDKALFMSSDPATRELPTWNASDTTVSAAPVWPVVYDTLADDGVREALPATETAFNAEIAFSFAEDAMTADSRSFTITFSAPVNPREFGIGSNVLTDWTLNWADDNQAVTVAFDQPLTEGQAVQIVLFRLRDMDGNMIGQDGLAGPVCAEFVVQRSIPIAPSAGRAPRSPGFCAGKKGEARSALLRCKSHPINAPRHRCAAGFAWSPRRRHSRWRRPRPSAWPDRNR